MNTIFVIFLGIILIFAAIVIHQKYSIKSFLKKHGFINRMIVKEILYDFSLPKPKKNGCDMSPTWLLPPQKNPENQKVIVIDAGGTNFRSCLVSFNDEGKVCVSDFKKTFMPAIEREYSKEEFFEAIADRIDYLKDKAQTIGFCFSYSIDMTKDGDAVPNAFSKEIKASSVVGFPIGKNLKIELENRGWKELKKITVINDTVSALLSGKAFYSDASSYIGFILGTGMNAAFIDEKGVVDDEKQIIVTESGKTNTFKLSDFDIDGDKRTALRGQFLLEKCCSGAYLGNTVLSILHFAAQENLFSKESSERFINLKSLSTIEADSFLHGISEGKQCKDNPIMTCCAGSYDKKVAFSLIDSAVDRACHYAASLICACILKSGSGMNKYEKICVVMNGTTLYKTYRMKERIEKYLCKYLSGRNKRYYYTVTIENDIITGSAVAGLI